MSYAKAVVFTLPAFGKAAEAVVFAVGQEIIPAARQDLMAVSLVAYIPYQLIVRVLKT